MATVYECICQVSDFYFNFCDHKCFSRQNKRTDNKERKRTHMVTFISNHTTKYINLMDCLIYFSGVVVVVVVVVKYKPRAFGDGKWKMKNLKFWVHICSVYPLYPRSDVTCSSIFLFFLFGLYCIRGELEF